MKKSLVIILALAMIAGSCTLNRNSDSENIEGVIIDLGDLLLSGYETGTEDNDAKTAITPIIWYRDRSDTIDYNIDMEISGDTADVTVTAIFPGTMKVYYVNDSLDTVLVEKNFLDTLTRFVTLVKDTVKEFHGGWRLLNFTGAEIMTNNPASIKIDSVKIYKGGVVDTTITDIFNYFSKDEIMVLPAGELVEITLYSPDTSALFFIHSKLRRAPFAYSNGVYTGTWRVPLISGTYRVAFDGMTEGTLFDDEEAYSAYGWMLPYKSE